MADTRDPLEVLKFELQFLEQGGYGRSPHTPWRPPLVFEDSLSCINFNEPEKSHPCNDCLLMQFVPAQDRHQQCPCRFIPLDERGETLDSLYRSASQQELEEVLASWLRRTIARLERERQTAESRNRHPEVTFGTVPEVAGGDKQP